MTGIVQVCVAVYIFFYFFDKKYTMAVGYFSARFFSVMSVGIVVDSFIWSAVYLV